VPPEPTTSVPTRDAHTSTSPVEHTTAVATHKPAARHTAVLCVRLHDNKEQQQKEESAERPHAV
jgi:hypothetical protein